MAQKKKKTIWHKRRNKFVAGHVAPVTGIRPGATPAPDAQPKRPGRKQEFMRQVIAQIKKAVHDEARAR